MGPDSLIDETTRPSSFCPSASQQNQGVLLGQPGGNCSTQVNSYDRPFEKRPLSHAGDSASADPVPGRFQQREIDIQFVAVNKCISVFSHLTNRDFTIFVAGGRMDVNAF